MGARLLALAHKEFIQMRRDRRTLAMMVLLPVLWLIMFGYAFNFDIQELRVAVIDQSGTRAGRLVADALLRYPRFRQVALPAATVDGIRTAIHRGELQMGVVVPAGYGGAARGETSPPLQVFVDGANLFAAQASVRLLQKALEPVQDQLRDELTAQVQAELQAQVEERLADMAGQLRERLQASLSSRLAEAQAQVQAQLQEEWARRREALLAQLPPLLRPNLEERLATALTPPSLPPLTLQLPDNLLTPPRLSDLKVQPPSPPQLIPQLTFLYNPELKTANVMIPGLLGMVTMFTATLMTAVGIVREREYGTLEQLVVSPLRPLELMLGKLLPYALIAALDFALVYLAGTTIFGQRFAGNLPVFLLLSVVFLLTTLGLGLLISTVAQNQQQAMQLAFFAMYPQILLSGLIFPLESMPKVIQAIAHLMPFTYYVPIARGMFLKGQELALVAKPALILAGYGVATILLAALRFRRQVG